ncbi:MAG: GGDEF domain-containing protein [Desulfobulbaceae bacterium]|nr:GGDEF domain-containing protein [Desulfobulbaceae bacterium]
MKINAKLVASFGTVLVTTLVVFGRISYSTFTESAHMASDKIISLQSSEIIYHTTKSLRKEVGNIEQQLSLYMQVNACSLGSDKESKDLLEGFAKHDPLFRSISLSPRRGNLPPPEFQTWMDEFEANHFEPFLTRRGDDLLLLWPTQTPQGAAFFVITLDPAYFAAKLSSSMTNSGYLNVSGAAIVLTSHGKPLLEPVLQDPQKTLARDILTGVDIDALAEHVEDKGEYFIYRPADTLFDADLTMVVPKKFNQDNLVKLKNRILAAMLIVAWISVWIMLVIAYRISSPIRKLSKITKDIIEFNYTTEMEIPPSNDEIGELAENFENMRQKIKTLVTEDPLTQVYNRRFVMHLFDLAVLKASASNTPLCCIMMDIDFFKKVNDTYGHQGGDAVLMAVGKVLKEISRDYDTPARYGGEEFLCLLPETTLPDAVAIAERIRMAVKGLTVVFGEIELRCTVSLGVAEYVVGRAESTDEIIRDADNALYQAKENGRDQVVVCRQEPNAVVCPAGEEGATV